MMRIFKLWLVACSLLAGVVQAELAFKWSVEASAPMPYAAEALQGETFSLQATLLQYREPLVGAYAALSLFCLFMVKIGLLITFFDFGTFRAVFGNLQKVHKCFSDKEI